MKTLSFLPEKLLRLCLGLVLFLLVMACNRANEQTTESMAPEGIEMAPQADFKEQAEAPAAPVPPDAENLQAGKGEPVVPFKVIRNASLRFQVNNYQEALRTISTLIKRYQGFIVNSNETRIENSLQNSFTIRVPAKNLDNLVEALAGQAVFLDYKNISSEDVSNEFIDISARLKAKKAVEERYLDLLKQARSIKDILEIENQLRQIREEIESAQARINYINSQVAYSTVTLEIYETRAGISQGNSFWVRMLNALKNGWDILLGLFIGLLNIWPLLILLPAVFFGIKKFLNSGPPKN